MHHREVVANAISPPGIAHTQELGRLVAFDAGPGAAARIGLLLLGTDLISERALADMLAPDDRVGLFTTRLRNANPTTVANLAEHGPEIAAAADRLLPGMRLDAMVYGCTSGSIVLGYDTVAREIHRVRPGLPVTTPAHAAVAALRTLNVNRLALITPYTTDVHDTVAKFLNAQSFSIAAAGSFGLTDDGDMACVTPLSIAAAIETMDLNGADGIFISCTALRASEAIGTLERTLGLPVVTSHQALLWHALRAVGDNRSPSHLGRLWLR